MDYCEGIYLAIWKKTGQLVIYHKRVLGPVIEFDFGVNYLQCELGPACDFEIVGEL